VAVHPDNLYHKNLYQKPVPKTCTKKIVMVQFYWMVSYAL
jgi:hypothetical protein